MAIARWAAVAATLTGLTYGSGDALAASPADSEMVRLEEVVVTARRREESLQTVPVSITAFSGEQLSQQNVQSFSDIVAKVPGFVINPDNITQPNMFMRGIGSDIRSSASNPAVALFIDDVYLSRSGAVLGDIWDLERVEVLKGPQSTLFGKNAVAGLVNFVTRKPSATPYANAELTVGSYQELGFRGVISGPLSDGIAASLSISSRKHEGYNTNTLTGNGLDDLKLTTVRGSLRFTPSENLDVLFSADFTRRRGTGRYVDFSYTTRNQAFVNPSRRAGPISGPVCGFDIATSTANGNNLGGLLNCMSPDGLANVDDSGLSARVEWKSGIGKLTSLTAYRDSKLVAAENSAGTSFDFANIVPFDTVNESVPDDFFYQRKTDKANQLSQEFRLASDSDGPWSWIGGLYFLHEKIDRTVIANYLFPDIFWYSGTEQVIGNTVGNSLGIFAEGMHTWSNGVGVTIGARYSHDKKDWEYAHTGDPINGSYGKDANGNDIIAPGGFTAKADKSWSAFTPNIVVDWKRQPGQYYYARVARGYQSGGFAAESSADNPIEAVVPFNPEFALNYEVGAKLDLLDRRLRINPTLYWTEYTDLQTSQLIVVDPQALPQDVLINAGKARSRGLEIEVVAVPAQGVQIYGNYAYLDCRFTADLFITQFDSQANVVNKNLKGNTCRRSPKSSFNVGSRVEWAAGSLGSVSAEVDYNWQDKLFFDNDNNSISANKSQFRLDASLGLKSQNGRWQVTLWGKNLTDELLLGGRALLQTPDCRDFQCGSNSETLFNSYLPPRTYGLTVRWHLAH
jgi:iron complex outermembrane recepter protein